MDDETTEELLQKAAEGAANFLRGASIDPRLPADMKQAFMEKAGEIDDQVNAAEGF